MSNFKTPLVVSPLPDGKHWKLHTKFVAQFISGNWTLTAVVPAGFITDFASVPWPFWSFIRPWGRWGKAAILHDYCYQHHEYLVPCADPITSEEQNALHIPVSRKHADHIFYEAMQALGVALWRRKLMYWGVRLFGWLAWK